MKRMMLSGKIHTARVTRCVVDYEGSLEIDPELLEAANILPYEKILVANRNNGSRLETYAIPGQAGSRDFCLNGPAAKLGNVGDVLTIMAFSLCDEEEARNMAPSVIVLDSENKIAQKRNGRKVIE
jgi:aspartate 1-decarboxylase